MTFPPDTLTTFPPGPPVSRRRAGFTVLEVMVALAIFAMAAIVLGAAYVNVLTSYEAAARGTQVDEDIRFARQLLLEEGDLKKVNEGGDFESAASRRIRWSGEAEPTNLPDLFTVTFTCEITDGEGTRKHLETFRVLRPSWSEAAERDKLRQEAKQRIEELSTDLAARRPALRK